MFFVSGFVGEFPGANGTLIREQGGLTSGVGQIHVLFEVYAGRERHGAGLTRFRRLGRVSIYFAAAVVGSRDDDPGHFRRDFCRVVVFSVAVIVIIIIIRDGNIARM